MSTMAASENEIGRRLLASTIDYLARHEPARVWASIPVDGRDVNKGFRDITFKQLANAVDHAAWWLKENLPETEQAYETITYNGPFDVQYPILAVAAIKCSKRLLLLSPWATPTAQIHLMNQSGLTTYFHSPYFTARIKPLLDAVPHVRSVETPLLHEWLGAAEAPYFPYEKTWEDAADEPVLVFHSSGTTGLPKMIEYTNSMMASFDAAQLMPDASDPLTMVSLFTGQRFFAPIPPCHFTGLTAALQWPIFLDNVFIGGPTAGPITAAQCVDVMKLGRVSGVVMSPLLIEDICREPDGLETLRKLEWASFAGAPCPRHVAAQIEEHCRVMPGMGSTEHGTYWTTVVEGPDGWECYKFRPANGIVMEPRGDGLHELVFHRRPELARWQQIFKVFGDVDVFPTRDLFTRHPRVPDAWRFAGRADDWVLFGHAHMLHATDLQHLIQEAPGVRAALVGGAGRARPFLIVDLADGAPTTHLEKEERITELWPYVDRANARCTEQIQFAPDLILFTDPRKPLPMAAKGTVVRSQALELYADEVDRLYDGYNLRHNVASVSLDVKPVERPAVVSVTEQPLAVEAE